MKGIIFKKSLFFTNQINEDGKRWKKNGQMPCDAWC